MSYFATSVFFLASIVLAVMSYIQSERVSWRTDKCGCVGAWSIGAASVVMLGTLIVGSNQMDAAAGMVLAFVVWMACRAARREHWLNGVLGHTDNAPLSKE
jgi:peptidoglycan/LPS O-acetylase OafA/YrhL